VNQSIRAKKGAIMKIHFIDGISIEIAGPLRILHLGYYVIGEGNLIPVDSHIDGLQTIANMKVFRRGAEKGELS
jgi:hypothetical protein